MIGEAEVEVWGRALQKSVVVLGNHLIKKLQQKETASKRKKPYQVPGFFLMIFYFGTTSSGSKMQDLKLMQ